MFSRVKALVEENPYIVVGATLVSVYGLYKKIKPLTIQEHVDHPRQLEAPGSLFPHYFLNDRGQWIYTRQWLIPQPKAYVFICHGMGEHIGRYEHIARYLNKAGYSVVGMDHHGHGQSNGDRCLVQSFSHLVDDFLQFVKSVDVEDLPRFLIGHSMGGGIAIQLVCREPELWKGTVLSGPMCKIDPAQATPLMVWLAKTCASVLPRLALDPIPPDAVAANPAVVQAYKWDSLNNHGGMQTRTAMSMLEAMADIAKLVPHVEWPFFLSHGEKDTICSPSGSTDFFTGAKSKDKEIKIWPGLLHEPFNEVNWEEVIGAAEAWIAARV